MSADHRKPVVAFVLLVFIAAALVFVQRADARDARFFAAFIGATGQTQGSTRVAGELLPNARPREGTIGYAFEALSDRGPVTAPMRLDGAPFGRARVTEPLEAAGELGRGRRERRAAREPQPDATRAVGRAARHASAGEGAGSLEKTERSLLRGVDGATRGLGSSHRSAGYLESGARRALGRVTDRVRERLGRLPGQEPGDGPRDW